MVYQELDKQTVYKFSCVLSILCYFFYLTFCFKSIICFVFTKVFIQKLFFQVCLSKQILYLVWSLDETLVLPKGFVKGFET